MTRKAWAAVALLLAGAWAGCITAETPALEPAGTQLPLAANVTSYLHNLSEPTEGLTVFTAVLEHLPVPGVDGFLLDTWVVRPPGDAPVPLVLEVTPYYGGGPPVIPELEQNDLGRLAEVLVPRGYAVGLSSVRGTGNSEGCFTMGGPSEAKDTATVIETLAAQPWSNGHVGLIGVSYPGTTPQDVWVEAPPALKTIVPISGISDLYKYNFVNGVPIDIQGLGFNAYYWAMVGLSPAGLGGGVQALDPASAPGAIVGEACTDQLDVQEGGVSSTLDGNKDAYWQARDFLAELQAAPDAQRASVFYIHGLQDWNVKPHMMEDWLPALQETGVPMKVWLGQWGHAWPYRDDWWENVLVAWFDQFLKGVDTGILDAPRVQVEDDDNVWRHEDVWPPTDVEWITLHPTADGALAQTPGEGAASYHDGSGQGTPQAESILFRSEPLPEDMHVSGLPRYEGIVTADGRRASLMLSLCEEMPDGMLRAFNFAAQSLNHAASLESGTSDVSGQPIEVAVDFFPQDDVLHKGNRVVLVAAGDTACEGPAPPMIPLSDGGRITLDLASARLSLPIDRTLVVEDPQPEKP